MEEETAASIQSRRARSARTALVIYMLLAALLPLYGHLSYAIAFPIELALIFACSFVCTAVHELGHVVIAGVVGLRVAAIMLGAGRALLSRRIGRCWLVVHALPVYGLTLVTSPTRRYLRWRLAATLLAGPFVNGAFLAALLPHAGEVLGGAWSLQRDAFLISLVVNASLTAQLVPWKSWTESDGLKLLMLPFRDEEHLQGLIDMDTCYEASYLATSSRCEEAIACLEPLLARKPDHRVGQLALSDALIFKADYQRARDLLRELIARHPPIGDDPVVLNNLAFANVGVGDPSLLDEADRLSERAISRDPKRPEFNGTRGAVLLEKNRIDEALPMLIRAYKGNRIQSNRALNASFLAVAEARRGRIPEACAYLAEARSLDPKCTFLDRAVDAIESATRVPSRDAKRGGA